MAGCRGFIPGLSSEKSYHKAKASAIVDIWVGNRQPKYPQKIFESKNRIVKPPAFEYDWIYERDKFKPITQ
jgi:hypothetical protein